jgi:hypothetical protein
MGVAAQVLVVLLAIRMAHSELAAHRMAIVVLQRHTASYRTVARAAAR